MTGTGSSATPGKARGFGRRYLFAILLGLPGVLTLLLLVSIGPFTALVLLANPLLLLVVFGAIGAASAPAAGLRSRLLIGSAGGDGTGLMLALAGGALAGAAIALLDAFLAPLWQDDLQFPSLIEAWSPINLVIGVLYGGVTEEVVMRFGLLSGLAWLVLKVAPGTSGGRSFALLSACIVAAALFAASHLPSLLVVGQPPLELVVRTLVLNFLLGVAFGLAYVWRDLETAIAMHAGFHVGVALLAISGTALP